MHGRSVSEMEIIDRLEQFRAGEEGFIETSFDTIAGTRHYVVHTVHLQRRVLCIALCGKEAVTTAQDSWNCPGLESAYWGGRKSISILEAHVSLAARFRDFLVCCCFFCFDCTGANSNGAIIHYCAKPGTCGTVTNSTLLLLDSGGQYVDGTTDVTRTVHLGTPTVYQRECFTRVLQVCAVETPETPFQSSFHTCSLLALLLSLCFPRCAPGANSDTGDTSSDTRDAM